MSEARVEDTAQDANGDFCVVSSKPKAEVRGTPVFDDDGQQVGIISDKPIVNRGRDNGSGRPVIPPEPINDPELLDDVVRFVRRYVVLTDAQADAVALWVAHTYAFSAADTTPYVAVTSAEKRSGKTRLLEVLELLVREPLPTANISDAALFRAIAELSPTLLLDEVDAIFGPKARDREDLRGMLNAGYRRGAVALRMGGARMTELQDFTVFCAKAFALIGDLPDTIADRAIRIRLERRTRDEQIERFRRRDVATESDGLRDRLSVWCEPQLDELRSMRPHLPDELDDRAQDCWEPLLALADVVGAGWPERARTAAVGLSGPEARQDEDATLSARLLADIRQVFSGKHRCPPVLPTTRCRTADLLAELCTIEESPWGDWYGKTLTAQGLSKLLRPYRIKTMPVKVEGETVRGYKVEQFADAFLRHLGVTGVTGVTSSAQSQKEVTESNAVTLSEKQAVTGKPASEAGSNAGNAGNAQQTSNGSTPWDQDEQGRLLDDIYDSRREAPA